MSQPALPQAAPPPAAAAKAPAPVPAAGGQPVPGVVDTPALLNRWQLIGMSVAIVFGILSALLQFLSWQSDGRAADDTAQLQRVQEIQSSLLHADALATNAFLVGGGLEDRGQRDEYDAEIAGVLKKIAEAAEAQPADQKVLQQLNVAVANYATAVAQARANNRQGFPIGAEYLSGARAQLDGDAIPILEALVSTNTDRAEGSMAGQHPFWLLLIGIAAVVALLWLNQQIAQAFRRRFNKGLAIAAAILLVVTLVAAVGAFLRDNSNDSLRDNEFATAVSLAQTRTAANQAKSIESLRLIKRGNGASFEKSWQAAVDEVGKGLARADAAADWNLYVERHQEIVKLDDGGNWANARTVATRTDDKGSSAPFGRFDDSAKGEASKQASAAVDDLRSGRDIALAVSVLTLLLGVAAAVAVSRGIGERRREFS